jgi:hypothetical protein
MQKPLARQNHLRCVNLWSIVVLMAVPSAPVTITPEQLKELNGQLSHMRHEINNQLSLIVAALELVRFKPDLKDRMLETMGQQPPKITAEVAKFSAEFERAFGITRESAGSAKGFHLSLQFWQWSPLPSGVRPHPTTNE